MKKALMLLLTGIMVFAANLAKASSRIESMSADMNVVEDYDLIFGFPNKIIEYKNVVDYRMENLSAGTSDDWAGILDGKHEGIGVVGVYMHRYDSSLWMGEDWSNAINDNGPLGYGGGIMQYINNVGGPSTPHQLIWEMRDYLPGSPNPLFDLFWGKSLGNADLGLRLSYADNADNSKNKITAPTADTITGKFFSRSYGIQAGLGLKKLGPFSQANFSAGYVMGSLEDSHTDSTVNTNSWKIVDDGIYSINLNALLQHDMSEDDNVRVFANAKFERIGVKGTDYGSPTPDVVKASSDMSTIDVGLGCNHKVNEGTGLVSAGVKLNVGSWTDKASMVRNGTDITAALVTGNYLTKAEYNWLDVPVFVSTEAKVASWLTLRAGANYYLYTSKDDKYTYGQHTVDDTFTYAENINFNTGFGINWKNWMLDAVMNTNALENQLSSVQPGRGVFFVGDTLTVYKADLRYKF